MLRVTHALAAAVATSSLGFVACYPANASPTPAPSAPPSTTQTGKTEGFPTYRVKISTDEYDSLKYVRTAAQKNVDSHGKLNWARTKQTFGKHSSLRDSFGAGWWVRTSSWHQFTHISKSDKEKIVSWGKSHDVGPNPKVRMMRPKPCTGVSFLAGAANGWAGVDWMNSCDTNTLKLYMDVCIPVAGLVASVAAYVKDAPVAVPLGLLTVVCGGGRAWVGYAQDASTLNAIKIYFVPDGKHGRSVYALVSIVPQ